MVIWEEGWKSVRDLYSADKSELKKVIGILMETFSLDQGHGLRALARLDYGPSERVDRVAVGLDIVDVEKEWYYFPQRRLFEEPGHFMDVLCIEAKMRVMRNKSPGDLKDACDHNPLQFLERELRVGVLYRGPKEKLPRGNHNLGLVSITEAEHRDLCWVAKPARPYARSKRFYSRTGSPEEFLD
jgi:hypothetical protein